MSTETEKLRAAATELLSAMETCHYCSTHSASHDCQHSPNCGAGENHSVMVKVPVGPFTLQREYRCKPIS